MWNSKEITFWKMIEWKWSMQGKREIAAAASHLNNLSFSYVTCTLIPATKSKFSFLLSSPLTYMIIIFWLYLYAFQGRWILTHIHVFLISWVWLCQFFGFFKGMHFAHVILTSILICWNSEFPHTLNTGSTLEHSYMYIYYRKIVSNLQI